MKKLLLVAICALPGLAMAQTLLYNDGATIKIDPGAVLVVEGGVTNTASGTINNDGTLEIHGNFVNSGSYDNAQPNTLRFAGTGPSTVTPGTAQFHQVVVQKTGANVILAGHMTITNNLTFSATGVGKIETGNNTLILNAATSISGQDSDEYIATTGTGTVQKNMTGNGTFAFPVGDPTNYSPITSTWTGSGYSNANIKVRVNDATHPQKPADATDYISRNWDVNSTGITGYNNTLVGTYIPADVNGTASLIKGAAYDGSEWSYAAAAAGANTVTGSTNDATADFTGTNFFGKADLIAFLMGNYNASGNGSMSTTLNTLGLIPLTSPYSDAPATATSIPAGVVDWVKVELRDPANPNTILGKASVFLKSDGKIVDLDGTALPRIKNGLPTSVVAVHHRNHLAIRTPNAGINVVSPSIHDFSLSLSNAYDNPSNTTNDAMKLATNGKYLMWAGNANTANATAESQIRYTGLNNDNQGIVNALGGNVSVILNNVYSIADLNLNGVVRYTGLQNDNAVLANTLGDISLIFNRHL